MLFTELRLRASEAPHAIALLAPGREALTFGELCGAIDARVGALESAGLTRGEVVAVVMPDGPELLSTILAATSSCICAPVNPGLREAELERCLADLGAAALIVDPALDSPAREVARQLGIPELGNPGAGRIVPKQRACNSLNCALLLHTSATTGRAKLVPLTHANLQAMAANTRQALALGPSDRFLSMMPLFHLQGLMGALAQLVAGGSVVCTSGFDAKHFRSWLDEYDPTWYTAGPALHQAILPLVQAGRAKRSLRFVRSIGAPLPQAMRAEVEAALGVPVIEGYGMTETGLVTSDGLGARERKPGSVGRSVGTEVAILGEAGSFLAPDCDGEIVVRGPAVMRAYANDPEANRRSFTGGWFRTGDLGRLDGDGFLFVTGRIKEMINRGGEKVLPGEVEEVLAAHAAVAEAAAFGVPHPTLGEDVAAAVVCRAGAAVTEAELRRFAASRLAGFKVPRRILFLDAIPKSATGKPKRAELSERFKAAPGSPPPGPPVEQRLAAIWKNILRVDRIGAQDDFFSLGGDSFALALMLTAVEEEFGVKLDLAESGFFSHATVETLARMVSEAPAADHPDRSPFVALQPYGSRIPFFCFPGADENPYYFRHLAQRLGSDQPFHVVRDPRPLAERGLYSVEEAAARFCAAVRALWPDRPYVLGGHCYGGIVAFEVARQLAAEGGRVALLALFEAPTPGYPKVLRHWKAYLRLLAAILRGRERVAAAAAVAHARVLAGLLRRKAAAGTRRLLARARLKRLIERPQHINLTNQQAARMYEPQPLHANVVQFVAAGEPHSTLILDNPLLGWREFAGSFTVLKAPGRARTIFEEPAVRELAAQLRALLDGANATEAAWSDAPRASSARPASPTGAAS